VRSKRQLETNEVREGLDYLRNICTKLARSEQETRYDTQSKIAKGVAREHKKAMK